jgi:cell division protein FtsB
MHLKVENETLVRDYGTGAILETDYDKLLKHRAMQAKIKDKDAQLDSLIERINKLEKLIERMTNGNDTL